MPWLFIMPEDKSSKAFVILILIARLGGMSLGSMAHLASKAFTRTIFAALDSGLF